jgi:glutamine synthetase
MFCFTNAQEVFNFLEQSDIGIVDFKIIDLQGRWHHLSIPSERFTDDIMTGGIGFDGSSYGFLTVEKSDMVFIPDLSTAFMDPFAETSTLTFIADIYRLENGSRIRFEDDPRYIAEKAETLLREKGIADEALFGPEFEFYVLDHVSYRNDMNHMEVKLDSCQAEWNTACENQSLGVKVRHHGGYHVDVPFDSSWHFRNQTVRLLEDHGVPVKYHHSENGGPGQVEIEVEFAGIKEMADRTQKLKYILRNNAFRNHKTVTLMPKPFAGEAGSGMHVHMHFFKDGKPLFYDADGYSGMSQTALHAIGGILKHAASIMPFTNPSTNSYKRLVPGFEAPVSICFGTANRSAVIRIPAYATEPETTRFELRSPDATCNPYLAYAAILLAALDGIENRIDPTQEGFGPLDVNLYTMPEEEKMKIKGLPVSLLEACDALKVDREFLTAGGTFTENLLQNHMGHLIRDHYHISSLPHPEEFRMYYDL